MESTATSLSTTAYAGFGQRFLALIIDSIIVTILYMVVVTPIIAAMGFGIASEVQSGQEMDPEAMAGMVGTIMAGVMSAILVVYVIFILYYALMESSKTQGSLGKMAMGIKVTDLEGNRISFGKALLRSFGKILSSMVLYIGYIMAAFTDKKQGLHDMIASTLVLKK